MIKPNGNRLIWRATEGAGPGIHHIACTTEEHRWVCQQLARRRAKLGNATSRKRQRRASTKAKAVQDNQAQ